MENSKIEWTTHTFNPWRGCTKIAAGCVNCYADRQSKRNPGTLGIWGDNGSRVIASEEMWGKPVKWNKAAACIHSFDCNNGDHSDACPQKNRPRVFCASLADWAEDWQGRPVFSSGEVSWYGPVKTKDGIRESLCRAGQMLGNGIGLNFQIMHHRYRPGTLNYVRQRLFALIDATPNLDWLLLTKRTENIKRLIPSKCANGDCVKCYRDGDVCRIYPNVWLGTSISTQEDADRNIPELLKCRDIAKVLFVSAEPLLGSVDLNDKYLRHRGPGGWISEGVDWVIAGGESGPNARPMHPDWARSLRDQCEAAGVPFFFKQWGEYCHWSQTTDEVANRLGSHPDGPIKLGKKAAGNLLDGRQWLEVPNGK
jgi:protein gp37